MVQIKNYKGLNKSLNVIAEKEVNGVVYLLVNGYKDAGKIVGYNNKGFDRRFVSYTDTQFSSLKLAEQWFNSIK